MHSIQSYCRKIQCQGALLFTLALASIGAHAQSFPVKPMKLMVPAIASVADAPQILSVRADLPVLNFDEFAAYVKAHEKEMNWGTGGVGSGAHLGGLQVNSAIGHRVNTIHYPGSAQAVNEVMAGRIEYMVESITTAVSSVGCAAPGSPVGSGHRG